MGFFDALKSVFGTIGRGLSPIMSTIGNGIKTVATQALPVIRNIGGSLIRTVGNNVLNQVEGVIGTKIPLARNLLDKAETFVRGTS